MAYATDIITPAIEKTKELFFPINPKYWLKLGFVNMLSGNQAGSYSGGSGGNTGSELSKISFREAVRSFNSEALVFLSQYGYVIGFFALLFYLLSITLAYLGSMFTFVFFEGITNRNFEIKKSVNHTKKQTVSLFMFRFVFGLISLASLGVILWPVIQAFMSNSLADISLISLIPNIIGFFIFAIAIGFLMFIVNDFLVPIMYLKNYGINEAWHHFKKIAGNKKTEILIYMLMKFVLGIASGIIALIYALFLLIPGVILALVFVGIGIAMFFTLKLIGDIVAVGLTAIYVTILIMFLIYLLNVLFVPIPAFFRIYSIDMVKKLEKS